MRGNYFGARHRSCEEIVARQMLASCRKLTLPKNRERPIEERPMSRLFVEPTAEVHVIRTWDIFAGVHVLEEVHDFVDDLLVGEVFDALALSSSKRQSERGGGSGETR